MRNFASNGHIAALVTILIWGTTFISTKLLLIDFTPIEILFFRFVLGFVVLLIIFPYRMKLQHKKHELLFICAGLCGVTLYYLRKYRLNDDFGFKCRCHQRDGSIFNSTAYHVVFKG